MIFSHFLKKHKLKYVILCQISDLQYVSLFRQGIVGKEPHPTKQLIAVLIHTLRSTTKGHTYDHD